MGVREADSLSYVQIPILEYAVSLFDNGEKISWNRVKNYVEHRASYPFSSKACHMQWDKITGAQKEDAAPKRRSTARSRAAAKTC
jgi:hypothetical protein